ncbi:MAG: response regulator transcription factor [Elusimicrobia bacterium]|nr:response regulator transcription factor [Elusimicrobiota bacterium]
MARARVLVVEDDESYQELYQSFFGRLHKDEFIGLLAKTGKAALNQLKRHPSPPIDAVVLDWHLPDTDGLSLLRRIRANPETRNIVVFMVTGNQRDKDADIALESRADEYFTKPFRERELYLKLRNHLERWRMAQEDRGVFTLEGLCLSMKAKAVTLVDNPVHLQPKEFDLLALLLERPGVVHPQDYLADAISTASDETSPEDVRKHIHNLRKALGEWGARIEARYGQGYVLHEKPQVSRN